MFLLQCTDDYLSVLFLRTFIGPDAVRLLARDAFHLPISEKFFLSFDLFSLTYHVLLNYSVMF